MFIISARNAAERAVCIAGTGKWLKPVAATIRLGKRILKYRKELIMIVFDVNSKGITARLLEIPKPETSDIPVRENEDKQDVNETDEGGEKCQDTKR
jgi:hypothetical protein